MKVQEEIVSEWKELKEKINTLKLSESDKKIVRFLDQSQLAEFSPFLAERSEEELDKWEAKSGQVGEKLEQMDPDNDLLLSYYHLTIFHAMLITKWIEKQRDIISLRKVFKEQRLKLEHCFDNH